MDKVLGVFLETIIWLGIVYGGIFLYFLITVGISHYILYRKAASIGQAPSVWPLILSVLYISFLWPVMVPRWHNHLRETVRRSEERLERQALAQAAQAAEE